METGNMHTISGFWSQKGELMPKTQLPADIRGYLSDIGRKGGMATGRKGFATLTPEQRKASAKKAAQARWAKKSVDTVTRLPHTDSVHERERE
jgi:aerobic-type carbon monoxide dehydrogenase small subunit (CoxS/CutS family)